MPNERNRIRKGGFPEANTLQMWPRLSLLCGYITVNTRAICVADTIVRVNRCTQVIVAALIDYWLRNNDHWNNPVIDNNTRRFLYCNLTPGSIDCPCLDQWLATAHRSSDRGLANDTRRHLIMRQLTACRIGTITTKTS